MNELKFAIRQLLKKPGFSAIVILTLALGIGANTAIFSIVDAVLLQAPPFKEPDRLVTLWERSPSQGYEANMPAPANYLDWKKEAKNFESMAIFNPGLSFALTGEGKPRRIHGTAISSDLLDVLGVRPKMGRGFVREEETPGRDDVAIISQKLWSSLYNSDPNILGRSVSLDGTRRKIIGVMPGKFLFPGGMGVIQGFLVNEPADVWVPLSYEPLFWQQRSFNFLQAIGRLKPGVTIEQANAELNVIQARLAREYDGQFLGTHTKVVQLREQSLADVRGGISVLVGAVLFILLMACANVGNLMLARASSRQREFAVRLALGANRFAVFKQLFSECFILSFAGGGLGVLISIWTMQGLKALLAGKAAAATPGWNDVSVNGSVLLFTLTVSVLCAFLFAMLPGWNTSTPILQNNLKEEGRSGTAGRSRQRFRNSLVVAQVALALMLLVGAALMIQSFVRLLHVSPGFEPSRVLALSVTLPEKQYSDAPKITSFFNNLVNRIQVLPGIQSAAMGLMAPFGGAGKNYHFVIEGHAPDPNGKASTADLRPMTPDFFRVLGIPILKGRPLEQHDTANAAPVVLINQTFVRRYFPNEDPIGKRINGAGGLTREIIGVVRDFKQQGLNTPLNAQMYTPLAQSAYFNSGTILVRATGSPAAIMEALRREVAAVDKDLPIDRLETMESLMAGTVAQPRFRTWILGLFGVLALLLAVLGIYGVLAHLVQQRNHEIGIRLALGSQPRQVLGLILSKGMRLVAIGLFFGLIGTFLLNSFLSALLYDIKPSDPGTIFGVMTLLLAVGFFASYFPARRAASVDPNEALRCE
jgi:putative ABC transport system permease protein